MQRRTDVPKSVARQAEHIEQCFIRLKGIRQMKGFSGRDVGSMSGLSESVIERLEQVQEDPRLSTLCAWANALVFQLRLDLSA